MLNSIKAALKRTPWGQRFSHGRMRHHFWAWTPRDQRAVGFYGQFIKPGDTVIDVGANRGNRAKIFLKLGAHTVLVEPQPACVDYLKIVLHGTPGWTIMETALGSSEGEQDMYISSDDVLSTLSPQWLSAVQSSGRFQQNVWDKVRKTPVTTLDAVIRKHGSPSFIKIDVEGYEKQVITGLSLVPKALSFEFTPEYLEDSFACVDHLLSLDEFEFQLSLLESMTFALPQWLSGTDLKNHLRNNENPECFGDIYARRIQ